jgi:hypothetical protein
MAATILIKSNINTGQTNIEMPMFNTLSVHWNVIHIKQGFFDPNSDTVIFDNISFGHKVYKKNINTENHLIHDHSFPADGSNPVSTNMEYEESTTLYVDPENSYTVESWFRNAGKFYTHSIEFETPTPPDFESEFLVFHPDTESMPLEFEHVAPPGAAEQMPSPDFDKIAYKPV